MEFCTLEEEEFIKFSETSDEKTFMQTKETAEVREKNGWKKHYVGVKENSKIIAGAMLVSKKTYFGKTKFYSPRGFLLDYHNEELFSYFTEEIKKYVKKYNGYEIKIDPYVVNVERDSSGQIVEGGIDNRSLQDTFKKLGYIRSKKENMEQVNWMYCLDIEGKTEEEILKGMKANTRNIIRKNEKNEIEIIELEKNELKDFYKIMEETGKRKNFAIRSLKHYEDMYDAFKEKNEIKYIITKLNLKNYIKKLEQEKEDIEISKNKLSDAKANDGKRKSMNETIKGIDKKIKIAKEERNENGDIITLSGSMFILTKPEIVYLSSGNYEEYLQYNSQYLIQWEMIKYAIKNGYKRYNFYGITGNFDKNDKDYGIYKFKTGFGGYTEELIGEYTLPTSFFYYIIKFLKKLKVK